MKAKPKLLYIDDEEINVQLFKINFMNRFEIFTSNNGFDGLTVLEDNPEIEFVISDMKMPKMNGIEFCRKAKEKFPNIKYYILTGYDINEELQYAIESNLILKCFRKPFKPNEIESTLNE